jgi:ectoine hydroxylase-related dioxygenase (phytanoyl-CoA dioxygenase family)
MSLTISQMPELDSEYRVSTDDINRYRQNGHVLLRGVCSPEEIAVFREVLVSAAERYNTENRPMEERDTYGKAFLQIMNLWERDEASKQFTFSKRFAKLAADLMGIDSIRLYHDQALFKEAGGGHTPWHQDQYYWPLLTDNTITMWMPLVDASAEMGTMSFASGSHKKGYLGKVGISDESDEVFSKFVADKGYTISNCGAMKAGDASFHSGWTLHSAGGNRTNTTREAMTIIFFEDGAYLMEPDNENRWADLERWHPGQKPGEMAGSGINPMLFKR